jgi:Kef-type K+ transport system membrane component KefB
VSVHLAAETAAEVLPGAITFVVIGMGAFLLPLIARQIRVPAVVLEILYGLLIGPAALGIIGSETVAEGFLLVLAELGLLLLMFLAGFEIDFAKLEREGARPIVFGMIFYGAIVAVAWVGFGLVGLESLEQQAFMTLLVSAAALGVIIPALRSGNRVSTRQGQAIIVIGVLAEFLAATGIVVFGVWIRDGFGLSLLAVPLFLLVGVIALVAIRRLAWWYPDRADRLFSGSDPDELGIRASLALLFVFVGLSLALGIDPILGAFFAGAMFAYVFRSTGELETRLSGFAYGFFVPIFFISVGVRFPLDALRDREVLALAFAVIVVAIAAKVLPSPLLMFRGLSLRDSASSGVLLAGQLSVIIALAEVGVQIGVIDEGLEAGAILLVGVTAVLSPIIFRAMSPPLRSESIESVVEEWDR